MLQLSVRAIALFVLFAPFTAIAQDWPTKQPIKVIVPFSAGSATDVTARTVFDQVGKQIGQTIVVENRGGAGTTIGSGMVAKAQPDGYTLLVNSTSHVVVASTYAKLSYNVERDFAPISLLASIPFVIATPPKYKTLKEGVGLQAAVAAAPAVRALSVHSAQAGMNAPHGRSSHYCPWVPACAGQTGLVEFRSSRASPLRQDRRRHLLADHDGWNVGVGARHRRHDRGVGDAHARNPVDARRRIGDRAGIALGAHAAGA
jgi:hypothetical protein